MFSQINKSVIKLFIVVSSLILMIIICGIILIFKKYNSKLKEKYAYESDEDMSYDSESESLSIHI